MVTLSAGACVGQQQSSSQSRQVLMQPLTAGQDTRTVLANPLTLLQLSTPLSCSHRICTPCIAFGQRLATLDTACQLPSPT
jgi:hypothetical protein